MGLVDNNLLTIITFFPLVTGLALLATSAFGIFLGTKGLPAQLWRGVGFASTLLNFLLSLRLVYSFDAVNTGFQFVEYRAWLPEYGINYFLGVDGISLFLIVLTTFLMPIVLLASWNDISTRVKSYVFFMLFLETGMLGAFVTLNLFAFYVFWELMLVPMYFIIGMWGGPRRVYSAVKFFLFTMFGSLFMLVAMISLYFICFEQTGAFNFDLVAAPGTVAKGLFDTVVPVAGEAVWWKTQIWLFAAFALAFAIKVPMVPFHTWLPDAHVEAPTAGSVVLAAVLLKMGAYGFLRFALTLFPVAAVECAPWILVLGLIGIVYGSLVAMVQADIKKLVAYSSVAHMGFVMLGIFAFNVEGMAGGVLQMINHGISTGALFLLVGLIYERRHTRLISDFGGIAKPMPIYAAFFGVVTMSSIGLPMLNGFVGEFLILMGVFLDRPPVAIVATSGVVLAAVYMLWMYRRVMFGPVEHAENRSLIDLGLREKTVMVAMVIPMFWIGIYPAPFLSRIEPSVIELMRRVEERGGPVAAIAEEPGREGAEAPVTEAAEETAGGAAHDAATEGAEAAPPPGEMPPAEAPASAAAPGGEENP
jgi:NADH-quinone oxidoreductase subunit M